MPHITEGDLHAYLDGALSAIDPGAEERLTAHVARCGDCRARLERERELHDRSTALLAAALPETVEPPPFGTIRERADGRGTGASGGRSRLAWAASVAVALGAGWMGHALLGGGGRSIPDAPLASEAPAGSREVRMSLADEADESDTVGGAAAAGTRANEPVADADDRVAGADANEAAVSGRTPGEARGEVAEQRPAAARLEVAGAAAPAEEPAEEGAERGRATGELEDVEREVARQAAPAATEPVESAVPRVVDAASDVEARSEAFAGAAWRAATVDEAAEWVGRPLLGVPELEVVDITVTEVDGLRLARVRQALPDGAPLELVVERPSDPFADRDRAAARAAPESPRLDELRMAETVVEDESGAGFWRRVGLVEPPDAGAAVEGVRAMIDGTWVTLAAPVASDSLRAIVSRVHRLEGP